VIICQENTGKHQENVEDAAIILHWLEDTGLCYADNASENSQVK
jgi:hypothetical protein